MENEATFNEVRIMLGPNQTYKGIPLSKLSNDFLFEDLVSKVPALNKELKPKNFLGKTTDFVQDVFLEIAKPSVKLLGKDETITNTGRSVFFGNIVDNLGYRDGKKLEGHLLTNDYVFTISTIVFQIIFLWFLFKSIFNFIRKNKDNNKKSTNKLDIKNSPEIYNPSAKKLVILSVLSLSFYLIYWNHRQWRYIKNKENTNIWPILRSLFSIFFIFELLKKIDTSYNLNTKQYSILYVIGYLLSFFLIGFPLLIYVTYLIQKQINRKNPINEEVQSGEIWSVIIGLFIAIISLIK